ncbi:MAG: hypothetical protein GX665_12535 [Gammaproteobacteria bacterium]|nr:hypothetical protein [Gammaproteobacteria bacterium]
MNQKVDYLMQLWGDQIASRRYESAIPSSLAGLADCGGLMIRSGEPGSADLSRVARYRVMDRTGLAVDRHLVLMFQEPPVGLGAARAGSLYKLARYRYVTSPALEVGEQCRLLGVSPKTYHRWVSALHEYMAAALGSDLAVKDAWQALILSSNKKAAS